MHLEARPLRQILGCEIVGGDYIKTVTQKSLTVGGKEQPYTLTLWKGEIRAMLTEMEGGQEIREEVLLDKATYTDFGPKLGGGWCINRHQEFTPEERAEGRRRLLELTARALIEQGLW